jgi:hypothetical protein
MKVRLKVGVPILFHGISQAKIGDVVEVDEENGKRYIELGVAEAVTKSEPPVEKAVAPDDDVETATVKEEPKKASPKKAGPKALDEDEADAAKARVAAKRSGRAR